jgi:hypothetical protein
LLEIKQLKQELKKSYDHLDRVKKHYEVACKAADDARGAFERADKDLNVTKGQVDKVCLSRDNLKLKPATG